MPSLRLMRPILEKLAGIFDQYIAISRKCFGPKGEVPWWYREESCVSHLTAAALSAGLAAIQEFGVKPRGERTFPVDWWAADSELQVEAEVKQAWAGPESAWKLIHDNLRAAEKTRRTTGSVETTLAIRNWQSASRA
jgi:hypothetical protein